MIIPERYISVKISGTPVRKGGFIPIVNINEAFFELTDSYPAIMSRDACVYTVSVLPGMTVYKLVFNRMKHHGDGSDARLVIGFSVPAGFRLPDGTDASGVLHSLLEAFIGSFAIALPDGTFEYRFGRFDTTPLDNICQSIALIPTGCHTVVMKEGAPRGAIEVGGEGIAKVLSCLDREDFADISELIVAEHINTSVGGIGVTLKADSSETGDGGMDMSDGDDILDHGAVEDIPSLTIPDLLVDSDEESGAIYNVACPCTENRSDHGHVEADSYRGHRIWPSLLAGIVLGAVLAYVAFLTLERQQTPLQDVPVTADTSAVVKVAPDTLIPVKVETVFVEKKVVTEPVRTISSANQNAARPRAVAGSPLNQQSDTEAPATDEENVPAPIYKYDPEGERSL